MSGNLSYTGNYNPFSLIQNAGKKKSRRTRRTRRSRKTRRTRKKL